MGRHDTNADWIVGPSAASGMRQSGETEVGPCDVSTITQNGVPVTPFVSTSADTVGWSDEPRDHIIRYEVKGEVRRKREWAPYPPFGFGRVPQPALRKEEGNVQLSLRLQRVCRPRNVPSYAHRCRSAPRDQPPGPYGTYQWGHSGIWTILSYSTSGPRIVRFRTSNATASVPNSAMPNAQGTI